MSQRQPSLEEIFESDIQTLALTSRPGTVDQYQSTARRFLGYLRAAFPEVRQLSQLHRDPHLLGWFRWLCEQQPPLCNQTRILHLTRLRRLLHDLATRGYSPLSDLIRQEDFPPQPRYLPKPLSLHEDQLLQQELRQTDDLPANALLLIRATGIRIGECISLPSDCQRQVGPDQWALHIPLGKLHTERLVPADPKSGGSWRGSWPCVLWLRPSTWRSRKACCCHAAVAIARSIKPFARFWRRQLSEPVAQAM